MPAIAFYFENRFGNYIKIFCVQSAQGHRIPGIRRIETFMKWIHMVKIDRVVDITLNEAIEGVLTVARRDGILIGLSSGAVVAAFNKLRNEGVLEPGNYVLIFPDSGFKYVEQLSGYLESQDIR